MLHVVTLYKFEVVSNRLGMVELVVWSKAFSCTLLNTQDTGFKPALAYLIMWQ